MLEKTKTLNAATNKWIDESAIILPQSLQRFVSHGAGSGAPAGAPTLNVRASISLPIGSRLTLESEPFSTIIRNGTADDSAWTERRCAVAREIKLVLRRR